MNFNLNSDNLYKYEIMNVCYYHYFGKWHSRFNYLEKFHTKRV